MTGGCGRVLARVVSGVLVLGTACVPPQAGAGAGSRRVPSMEGAMIENGKVWLDTRGDEIWCNGGHMIEEGGTFYWVGYETAPGRPWSIKLYSSENLRDWTFRNNIIEKKGDFAAFGWAGRPGLLHNRKTGRYVVIFEAQTGDWFRHKVGFASCDSVDGEYKLEGCEYPEPDRSTGDQSVYQEGDDAYLLTVLDSPGLKEPLNVSMAIYKLTEDHLRVENKLFEGFDWTKEGQRGNEASHVVKVGETYYWFMSGLRGWNSTPTAYTTAKSLAGPWEPLRILRTDPPSDDSFNTQHDFIVSIRGTETTTYLYAGDRYSQWHGKGAGRNIFLPIVFEDGEPSLKWGDSWWIDPASGRSCGAVLK